MSVDIDWAKLTDGPDGARLAESIRAFVHDRFQQVTLPRFIRSVRVHSFDLGSIPPEVELKDICDPLPDFYDEGSESDHLEEHKPGNETALQRPPTESDATVGHAHRPEHHPAELCKSQNVNETAASIAERRKRHHQSASGMNTAAQPSTLTDRTSTPITPFLYGAIQSPGIPGGTSNLNYFHLPLGTGLSGTATPLAAMAGGHFSGSHANLHQRFEGLGKKGAQNQLTRKQERSASCSDDSLTPPSTADPGSRPPSRHIQTSLTQANIASLDGKFGSPQSSAGSSVERPEPEPQDIQIVFHVKYDGNLELSLTAEILLDYPMPSFVAIPLQLRITGVEFDGVAILAYIRRKAHFCFLSPEDANALVGRGSDIAFDREFEQESTRPSSSSGNGPTSVKKLGLLLENIKVESEIGDQDNGKQVLKNVGKVEKFVLEQVRKLFEEELVFPSFWTVLV